MGMSLTSTCTRNGGIHYYLCSKLHCRPVTRRPLPELYSLSISKLIIHILQEPATPEQITEMLEVHRFYIKTVVDIRRQILAGGGEMHSDCEAVLLDNGSRQSDIWGASWNSITQEIFYESMVNLRK